MENHLIKFAGKDLTFADITENSAKILKIICLLQRI